MKKIKAYITKDALTTSGIFVTEGTVLDNSILEVHVGGAIDSDVPFNTYYNVNDWHQNKECAFKRAEAMRMEAIAGHARAIERLAEIKFSVVQPI